MSRRNAILSATVVLLVVIAFGELAATRSITQWETDVLAWISNRRTPFVTRWMLIASTVGGRLAIPAAALIGAVLYRRTGRRTAACYLATTLSAWALSVVLKMMIHRPRPIVMSGFGGAGWYSYPSGHAMLAPPVFGLGAVLLSLSMDGTAATLTAIAGFGLTAAIAVSRVYLGVHYPSDVIGGLLAGCSWAVLGWAWRAIPARTLEKRQSDRAAM